MAASCAPASASQIFSYTYSKMDNPHCTDDNALTAIDDVGEVVGNACGKAWASDRPYSSWRDISYPKADGTYVLATDDTYDKAGMVSQASQSEGYFKHRGTGFSTYTYPVLGLNHILCGPNGGRHCHGNKGQSDLYAVGNTGLSGYLLDVDTNTFTLISLPGSAYTEVTGFNGQGTTVGNYNGGIWAKRLKDTQPKTFTGYPGARYTVAISLNWQMQIVGYYIDSNGVTHGFILTYPFQQSPNWQTIDVPSGADWGYPTGTVVTASNQHGTIVGYYFDHNGKRHGFLGSRVTNKST